MVDDKITRRGAIVGLSQLAVVGTVGCADEAGAPPREDGVASGEDLGAVESAISISAQPLKPLTMTGVHAYAQKSVAAGQTIDFRVSTDLSTKLQIVRYAWNTEVASDDWVVAELPLLAASQQVIRPGSYIHVQEALSTAANYSQMTLECWVRPWRHRWQGLISQYTYPTHCGFGLFLNDSGRPVAYFSNTAAYDAQRLIVPANVAANRVMLRSEAQLGTQREAWSHVVATFSAGTVRLYLNGVKIATATPPTRSSTVRPANAPLRIGAYGDNGQTANTLDGDIAMPIIHSVALSDAQVASRYNQQNPSIPSSNLHACWPLNEESGTFVADVSGNSRHGSIINRGTWMIGGPGYHSRAQFDWRSYNPATDSSRGNGLRLSSDDLFDCEWPTRAGRSYTIPADLPPGLYSGRLVDAAGARLYDTTFVVRRAAGKPAARILLLCNTNTWLAYNVPFPSNPNTSDWGLGGPGVTVAGAPAYSMYTNHASGAPAYQMGTKVPWSVFPFLYYGAPYSHLLRAEQFLHNWLEQNGYDYDVASDFDLHQTPSLLAGYKTMIINGHSEYWSGQAYSGLQQYLAGGGNVFVASGNTLFWRVSYDATGDVMECRKREGDALDVVGNWAGDGPMGGRAYATVGELYHSHDRSRGGLMREAGFPAFGATGLPAWRAIGLESVGYVGSGPTSYVVQNSAHSFFNVPESVGVVDAAAFASGAAHHEWDVRRASIVGAPADADTGHQVLAEARGQGHYVVDYACNPLGAGTRVFSEIIDWQRQAGGRVFAAGAIGIGSKIGSDAQLAALARNALHHFGVKQRVSLFVLGSTGRVQSRAWDGASWAPLNGNWDDTIGGSIQGPLQAVSWSPNLISIMGISASGNLLYRYWDGNAWKPDAGFINYGETLTGRPAAIGFSRNRLNIYARTTAGIIKVKWWDGANWSDWVPVGSQVMGSDPAAAVYQGQRVALAAIGSNGHLYFRDWNGTAWAPSAEWADWGGDFKYAPTVLAWGGGKLNVFAVNRSDSHLWTKHFNGSTWDPTWYDLGGSLASRPVGVARLANELSVFAVGTDGRMKVKWFNGSNWGPSPTTWSDLGGSFVGDPTAVSWRSNHVSVMGVSSAGTIQYKYAAGAAWFPSLTGWDNITGNLSGARHSPTLLSWIGS